MRDKITDAMKRWDEVEEDEEENEGNEEEEGMKMSSRKVGSVGKRNW